MDKLPKRRKLKDNPYTLLLENNNYYILFNDNKNIYHKEQVDKDVFEVFNESEKNDNNLFSEYSRHMSFINITDYSIDKNILMKQKSVEDVIVDLFIKDKIRELINKLPLIQKRRLIKYYYFDMTLEEIAKEEKCTKTAIKHSIDKALKNISKYFINYK